MKPDLTDKYYAIIKRIYPEANTIKIFENGWDFVVFAVDEKVIFRFPRKEEYVKKLPIETTFLKQFAKQSPISVPQFILHQVEDLIYVTSPFIPGVELRPDLAQRFTKENRMLIAKKLGEFLSTLHSFPLEKAKKIGIGEVDATSAWENRLKKIRREVFPHIILSEQTWIQKIFDDFLNNIKKFPPQHKVTHSDIMFRHILVDSATQVLSGIIDFGDIVIGDPAFDFTFFSYYGQDFLDEVYKNYTLPMDTNFNFRRKFYRVRSPIAEFEYALSCRDDENITSSKNELSQYIQENPLE